jgi:hypothetical protein
MVPVLQLDGSRWTIADEGRIRQGRLTGAPPPCVFSDIKAEHLVSTVAAAQATYDRSITQVGLTGFRVQGRPRLVEAEIPAGDYVDAVTPTGIRVPSVYRPTWGQAFADQGYLGIALPLMVGTPSGAQDSSVYVFIPPGSFGLRIVRTQIIR